jgi:uncharacterized protein (TIGR02391 family)
MTDKEKRVRQAVMSLQSLRRQFSANGVVNRALVSTYEMARSTLEEELEIDLSHLSADRLGSAGTRSVFVSGMYPAIDQILLTVQHVMPGGDEEDQDGRVARLIALIEDADLRQHCADILAGRNRFNRAIIMATTVFEDRLRSLTGAPSSLTAVPLINTCIKSEPKKSLIVLSDEASEQSGFANMCRGVMELYRNTHHHRLVSGVTRVQALKCCLTIDELLRLLAGAKLNAAAKPKWEDPASP